MKLTQILFRRNRMPNGHIFRGKERLVKQVTPVHLRRTRADFEVEEQNMFYLRFPYLTETQSKGHARALGKDIEYKQKWQDQTRSEFKSDVKLQDRLLHLRVSEGEKCTLLPGIHKTYGCGESKHIDVLYIQPCYEEVKNFFLESGGGSE